MNAPNPTTLQPRDVWIDGYPAVISYDSDISMFRGEFIDLNGGANFYAEDEERLMLEGQRSLARFLDACDRAGINPIRSAHDDE
jgi:predicted HicB family RNase H-like nuclease